MPLSYNLIIMLRTVTGFWNLNESNLLMKFKDRKTWKKDEFRQITHSQKPTWYNFGSLPNVDAVRSASTTRQQQDRLSSQKWTAMCSVSFLLTSTSLTTAPQSWSIWSLGVRKTLSLCCGRSQTACTDIFINVTLFWTFFITELWPL